MPPQPQWLLRVPQIVEELEVLDVPVLDRAAIEKLFRLRRRQAVELMHRFGGYQAGRTFLVQREALIRQLKAIKAGEDYQSERGRRIKVAGELERTRKEVAARQVSIVAPADVWECELSDLPSTIRLSKEKLEITHQGTEDLLRQLLELAQAISNDYERFQRLVG